MAASIRRELEKYSLFNPISSDLDIYIKNNLVSAKYVHTAVLTLFRLLVIKVFFLMAMLILIFGKGIMV